MYCFPNQRNAENICDRAEPPNRGRPRADAADAGRDGSDLVILDASDFTASPVATVALPQRVPFGFHGSWVPDAVL